MRIAVAGGTGLVGRLVVAALDADGHDTVVLARSTGVDLLSGTGLAEPLRRVDAAIDVSNIATTRAGRSRAFFETATANLLAAERDAGVAHHVALSIVGVDRVDLGYYIGKRVQERLVLDEGSKHGMVGTTVLRATQFHEFAAQMLERKGPVVFAPRMLTQPVAATEVARHLVELAYGEPRGMAPELAGPEEHLRMPDMVKRLARSRRDRRPVLTVGMPGQVGKALVGGGLLPNGPGPRGTTTFDGWLTTQAHDG